MNYYQKCIDELTGLNYQQKEHLNTTTGQVGIVWEIFKNFKGSYLNRLMEDGDKRFANHNVEGVDFHVSDKEVGEAFDMILTPQSKKEIESWK